MVSAQQQLTGLSGWNDAAIDPRDESVWVL